VARHSARRRKEIEELRAAGAVFFNELIVDER
jgi:hypothetical protein